MRRIYTIGLGVAVALAASSINAQEDLQWIGHSDEYGASLVYGVPETGFAPLAFYCERGNSEVIFSYEFEPIDARDGVEVIVLLQAGDLEVPIETTGLRLEMDDLFILEGMSVLDERLADLLTSRGTLYVFVEDGTAEYPLDWAREAAEGMLSTCANF
ncbi:hypothetical protein [Pelagibacterium limicola]|uniref:hypothetical protein n=1 Tax=Pelagibacterium limicola TaxID=2791022 RepID=UPI0018AF9DF7|nr:hypothetical protein [Pelagibacterium limicola]